MTASSEGVQEHQAPAQEHHADARASASAPQRPPPWRQACPPLSRPLKSIKHRRTGASGSAAAERWGVTVATDAVALTAGGAREQGGALGRGEVPEAGDRQSDALPQSQWQALAITRGLCGYAGDRPRAAALAPREPLPLEADTPPPVCSDPAPIQGTLWAHTEHTPVRAWDGAAHHRHPHPPTPWWFLEGAEAAPATASPSPLSADEALGTAGRETLVCINKTAGMWPPSPPGPCALASAAPMTQVLGFPLE